MARGLRGVHWKSRGFLFFLSATLVALVLAWPLMRRVGAYTFEDISFALHPSAQYAFELGNRHFRASDPDSYDVERAKMFYMKVLSIDSSHPMVYQQLARVAFVSGTLDNAELLINMQFMQHPDSNVSAYYIRALVYAFQKKFAQAALDYEQVIRMAPDRWPTYNDLAWTYMKVGRTADALSAIDRGLAIAPGNAWMHVTRASILYELGRYKEAKEDIEQGVAAARNITPQEWVAMYPGNSPATIPKGMAELKAAAELDRQKIEEKLAASSSAETARGTIRE